MFVLLLFSNLCCNAAQTTPGELNGDLTPSTEDKLIARFVCLEISKRHFLEKPVDDTIAKRALSLYLESLDPLKCYFYQSDIDRFTQGADQLAANLVKGDIQIGFDIYNTFLKRSSERMEMVFDILSKPFDFTENEEIIVDKELLTFPKTAEEAYDRWKKRIKYQILELRLDAKENDEISGKPEDNPAERLKRRYSSLQKRIRQTTNEEVLEMFLSSMTSAYDPHSSYMSPTTVKNFEILMGLKLQGIGATLTSEDGYTVIKNLVVGGPAEKDGRLKVDDKIVGVAQGKDGEFVDVVDMKLNDVVKMIRGEPNTTVKLEVLSSDGEKKIIAIVRAEVQLTDSKAHSEIFEVGTKPDGAPYRIGVINLPSFYLDMSAAQRGSAGASTTRDMRAILDKFTAENVDAVALDLRYNGGGSLPEAITTVGLFIETGTVVQTRDGKSTRAIPSVDPDPSVSWTGPLVVMVSKFSASASEIFAGAIKDYKRGIIVGDSTTHGKGTVQAVGQVGQRLFQGIQNAQDYGSLKMTIQRFYRPGGASPQIKGVAADIVIPSLSDHYKNIMEADLDYPLDYDEVTGSSYPTYNYITPDIIATLKQASQSRIQQSEEFQKTLKHIQTYLENKDRKMLSLNEVKFNEEHKSNTDKVEKDNMEKIINNEAKITRDNYLDEVLAITADYTGLLEKSGVKFAPPSPPQQKKSLFNLFY
jgi:carboxyl-terminal processing protease